MAEAIPDLTVRRGIERGLVATILVSAVIHAAAAILLLIMPGRWLSPPTQLESYTVDLVAPDVVGGTNLIAGGGKAKAPASKPGPAAPVAEAPAPEPAAKAAGPPAAEPLKEAAPVPPQPAAEPPRVAESAKLPEPPKPPAPPKAVEPPPAEPPKAVAVKPVEAKPPPPAPKAEPPKPVAKAIEPPKPPAPAKPAVAASLPAPDTKKKAAEPSTSETAAELAAKKRDGEIAAAVQRRAAQMPAGSGASSQELDKQIASAVQRRAQQAGAGGAGAETGQGGPISVGAGSGAGGTPADLEYILYHGRMIERIKAAWAWAGADKTLHAVIQFNLTPEGEIKNVHTVQPSGDARYDASCERAIRAVNPLEPVPEKYRKDFSTFELTFQASDLES